MTNREWIERNAYSHEESHHGNLFTQNGVMYSYGYHYPLLFTVNGLRFINTTGYSRTTAKHIGYSRSFADYDVTLRDSISPLAVMRDLINEAYDIAEEHEGLKRKNTKRARRLLNRLGILNNTIADLKETMSTEEMNESLNNI